MSPLLLVLLALLDASFAGFRDSTGRNPLLYKRRYSSRSFAVGFVGGCVALLVIWISIGVSIGYSADRASLIAQYWVAADRMLWVYGSYALFSLLALAFYASPKPEVSSLATVLILGPFTLIRPLVIIAGALWGGFGSLRPALWVGLVVAAATMVSIESMFSRFELNPRELERQCALEKFNRPGTTR